MTNYRRVYEPGGTYFFTINVYERNSLLLIEKIDDLRLAFAKVQQRHRFKIDAITILPDHLHCVLTFSENTDYSTVIRLIKTYFLKECLKSKP